MKLKFKELRQYISVIDRISICMRETLQYDNYRFMRDVSNAYYRLDIRERGKYHECGIYLSYEVAYQDGLGEEEAFQITKECFACKENEGDNEGVFGMIDFSKNGQVIEAASFWKEGNSMDSGSKKRFEGRGVGLPLLFRCGDIVKVLGRDIYGIVIAPEDEDEHDKMQSLAAMSDYSDFQVPVSYVFEGMEYQTIFSHGHISPAHLEFASLEDQDARKGFLEYMSKTIQNKSLFNGSSRDAGRMQEVLSKIEMVWKQFPDMRLGQLLVNVCGAKDVFAMEDEDLLLMVEKNWFG